MTEKQKLYEPFLAGLNDLARIGVEYSRDLLKGRRNTGKKIAKYAELALEAACAESYAWPTGRQTTINTVRAIRSASKLSSGPRDKELIQVSRDIRVAFKSLCIAPLPAWEDVEHDAAKTLEADPALDLEGYLDPSRFISENREAMLVGDRNRLGIRHALCFLDGIAPVVSAQERPGWERWHSAYGLKAVAISYDFRNHKKGIYPYMYQGLFMLACAMRGFRYEKGQMDSNRSNVAVRIPMPKNFIHATTVRGHDLRGPHANLWRAVRYAFLGEDPV